MVGAAETTGHALGMSPTFIGLVLLAGVGGAAELGSAVSMAFGRGTRLSLGCATSEEQQSRVTVRNPSRQRPAFGSVAPTLPGVEGGPGMAEPHQLEVLRQGVNAWNQWRAANPSVIVDLSYARLGNAVLRGARLDCALLCHADLHGADLVTAFFESVVSVELR